MKDQSDGRIRIRTGLAETGGRPAVLVEIQDNGPGMPPEVLSKIWDPFFTTKDQGEGSGLGLGIVQGIIEKHKGRIEVQSYVESVVSEGVERGTSFRVFLPVEGPGRAGRRIERGGGRRALSALSERFVISGRVAAELDRSEIARVNTKSF